MNSSLDLDKTSIIKEVTDQFMGLIAAINQKDADAWEKYYSHNAFESAAVGGAFFDTRSGWVEAITSNFSMRDSQQLDVHEVQVIPLAPDVALLTSQNTVTIELPGGQKNNSRHVFSMLWKKGPEDWRLIQSHESWIDESA